MYRIAMPYPEEATPLLRTRRGVRACRQQAFPSSRMPVMHDAQHQRHDRQYAECAHHHPAPTSVPVLLPQVVTGQL